MSGDDARDIGGGWQRYEGGELRYRTNWLRLIRLLLANRIGC